MPGAADYRAFADECMGWAKTARTDRERRIFLQMVETWLEAAAIAERKGKTRIFPMENQQTGDRIKRTQRRETRLAGDAADLLRERFALRAVPTIG